jgi:hypothetical protein
MRSCRQGHEALPPRSRPARYWEQLTGSDARPPARLRTACGFWQMGQIMLIAGIAAFTAAGLMLILSGLG